MTDNNKEKVMKKDLRVPRKKHNEEPKQQRLPIDEKAYIPYRRNLTAFRDLPSLVEKELIIRTRVENRTDWEDWKLGDHDDYGKFGYYDPWDYRLQERIRRP